MKLAEISLFFTESAGPRPVELGVAEIKVVKENNITLSQELEVRVEKLPPGSIFELFVNNIHIASFTVRLDGKANIEFSSNPKRGELFLPASINLSKVVSVAIKDRANRPILLGSERALPIFVGLVSSIQIVEIRNLSGQVILIGRF